MVQLMEFVRVHRDRLVDILRVVCFILILDLFLESPILYKFGSIYEYSQAVTFPLKVYNSMVHTWPFSLLRITPSQYMIGSAALQTFGLVTLITNPGIAGTLAMLLIGFSELTSIFNDRILPPNPICTGRESVCLLSHIMHIGMFLAALVVARSEVGLGGAFTRATHALYGIKNDIIKAGETVKEAVTDAAGTVQEKAYAIQEKASATLLPVKEKAQEMISKAGDNMSGMAHDVAQKVGIEQRPLEPQEQLPQEKRVSQYDVLPTTTTPHVGKPPVRPQQPLTQTEALQPLPKEHIGGLTQDKFDVKQRGELPQEDWPSLTEDLEREQENARFGGENKNRTDDIPQERLFAGQSG